MPARWFPRTTASCAGFAQLGLFTPEQRIQFSPDWKGERFADGRPKVPDETLARLKDVTAEEAWGVLRKENFRNQFEGNWTVVNPGPRLVGRVVTAVFMPYRPDFDNVVRANGKAEGRIGAENSWVIDILQPGDVLVVDLFGKVQDGTMIGDNLGTAIWTKSHNGLIVNGAVRDVSGIREIEGFQVFTKGVDPSALQNVMLTGREHADPDRQGHGDARRHRGERSRRHHVHPSAPRRESRRRDGDDAPGRRMGTRPAPRGKIHAGTNRRQVDRADGGRVQRVAHDEGLEAANAQALNIL